MSRSANLAVPLTVSYTLSGTATPGSDFEVPTGSVAGHQHLSVGLHEVRASVTDTHGSSAQAVVSLQLFPLQPPEPPRVPTKYELFALDGEAGEAAAGEPPRCVARGDGNLRQAIPNQRLPKHSESRKFFKLRKNPPPTNRKPFVINCQQ